MEYYRTLIEILALVLMAIWHFKIMPDALRRHAAQQAKAKPN